MTAVETALCRGKTMWDRFAAIPGTIPGLKAAGWSIFGFLLAGASLWGGPLPLAGAMVCCLEGVSAPAAALGAALGYGVYWPTIAGQGALWATGAAILAIFCRDRERLPILYGLMVAAVGFGLGQWNLVSPFWGGVGGLCVWLLTAFPTAQVFGALGVLALAPRLPLASAMLCGGAAAVYSPAGALLWAGAMELGCSTAVPMSLAAALGMLLHSIRLGSLPQRLTAPFLGMAAAAAMTGQWVSPPVWGYCLGCIMGQAIPLAHSDSSRLRSTGAVMVQLEQISQVLSHLQQELLAASPEPVDCDSLAEAVRNLACGGCAYADCCPQKDAITADFICSHREFHCLKAPRVLRQLSAARGRWHLLEQNHRIQEEYRTALICQYGFLSGFLQTASSRLCPEETGRPVRYHLEVSAKSRKKEPANGDSFLAFSGEDGVVYVLLCDGMGTGMGAAEDARNAASLLRELLTAGMPPGHALGCLNAQLVLRRRPGAVSVDLAEIRLDSGKAFLYKWGAPASVLLSRGNVSLLGTPAPPPGYTLTDQRPQVIGLTLTVGSMLILVSDGASPEESVLQSLSSVTQPKAAVRTLLRGVRPATDDATALAMKLQPVTTRPKSKRVPVKNS